MKLNREQVLHIARLARMGVTLEEVDRLSEQLSNILENFEALRQVNTEDVPPTAQSVALQNVTGEDMVKPSMPAEDVLANAPRQEQAHFKINAVLED